MKSIRRIFAAALLTSALAFSALADDGIMHGDRIPTPTPTPLAPVSSFGVEDSTAPAATASPSGEEVTATDIAIQCALSVLGEMFLLY